MPISFKSSPYLREILGSWSVAKLMSLFFILFFLFFERIFIKYGEVYACVIQNHKYDTEYCSNNFKNIHHVLISESFIICVLLCNSIYKSIISIPIFVILYFLFSVYETEFLAVNTVQHVICLHGFGVFAQVEVNTVQK